VKIDSRLAQLAGLTLVAGALAYGLHVVGGGIAARAPQDTVSVTGSAKQRIVSDYVSWDGSLSARAASPGAAAAQLDTWTGRVRAFLLKSGVQPGELTVSPVSTDLATQTDKTGNQQVTGYSVTRAFSVRSARVDAIVTVIESTSQLVREGVPLTSSAPQYTYTRLADLRPALSAAATKDALHRADEIVAQTGQKRGRLVSIDVAPFQLTPPGSIQGDYGGYDTTTRVKDVIAVVNVSFVIK
jgi:hypothetical protein